MSCNEGVCPPLSGVMQASDHADHKGSALRAFFSPLKRGVGVCFGITPLQVLIAADYRIFQSAKRLRIFLIQINFRHRPGQANIVSLGVVHPVF